MVVHPIGGRLRMKAMETFGKYDSVPNHSSQNAARAGRHDSCVRSRPLPSSVPMSMHHLKILFALATAAALSACGGGGGDSPTPPPPAPPSSTQAPVVGTNGTLQGSVTSASYTDARRPAAFSQLNAVRQGAGAGLLAQSDALDATALAHATYLTVNGFSSADSAHDETSGLQGFTGANPFLRMKSAGYSYSYATEVIGDIGSTSASSDCVGDLLDTVYHAASMLSRVTDVGFGFGSGTAAGMCTIDMASPLAGGEARQIPPSGAIVAYPYGGSTVAHGTFHVSNETPRVSIALLPAATAGTPVVVGFRNQDVVAGGTVTITQFSLATASGVAVPGIILAASGVGGTSVNADADLDSDFAVLVPVSPLAAGTYTVTLHATVSGGQALALSTWSFTVAAP
jgi:uncharacterized protein YkwD